MIDRRIADRRKRVRPGPDRRLGERRGADRWHATEALAASFDSSLLRHIGTLRDVSASGCMLDSTMTVAMGAHNSANHAAAAAHVGTLEIALGGERLAIEATLVRKNQHSVAVVFARALRDAVLARIVEAARAYSIQYRNGRVCFIGDLGNLTSVLHLLKCVRRGAQVDLSRARGDHARAAASMVLLRQRGAQLHGCLRYLALALEMVAPRICPGCYSDCEPSKFYNRP